MLSGWVVQCFYNPTQDGGDSRRRYNLGLRPFRQTPGRFSDIWTPAIILLSCLPCFHSCRSFLAFAWPQPQTITTHTNACMGQPPGNACQGSLLETTQNKHQSSRIEEKNGSPLCTAFHLCSPQSSSHCVCHRSPYHLANDTNLVTSIN